MELRNEFAAVEINLDQSANGPRLKITDLESGYSVHLDPYLLKALALMPLGNLEKLVIGGDSDE